VGTIAAGVFHAANGAGGTVVEVAVVEDAVVLVEDPPEPSSVGTHAETTPSSATVQMAIIDAVLPTRRRVPRRPRFEG
jgi:hypothetical protein